MKARQLSRKYPALALVGAAAGLALLLPSALVVPRSGPGTLAEFAPVPGQGRGMGDASQFGEASESALSGTGRSERVAPPLPFDTPPQRRATLKRCVGDPPRQSEDPLSPPCVAFFDGDNFGKTWKGVDANEIRVILFAIPSGLDSDSFFVDCDAPPALNDRPEDVACKAYAKFFNSRYQTYRRHVHIWVYHRRNGLAPPGAAEEIDMQKDPFAVFGTIALGEAASRRKILSVRYLGGFRNTYSDFAPLQIGFRPDYEDHTRIAASYVCRKLYDRPARFSGNEEDRSKRRVFGMMSEGGGNRVDTLMKTQMEEQCGLTIQETARPDQSGPQEAAKLRAAGVTTVLLRTNINLATQGATQIAWFPEWVLTGSDQTASYDTNAEGRGTLQAQWQNAMGLTFDYRRGAIEEQAWYKAYREGCSSCPEPADEQLPFLYDSLTMLFYGIQAAGPRLTPESLDRGMHAIPARPSQDPYRPAAYFAPGNYTFIKDAMGLWWDPQGRAPGDPQPGCYRLTRDGLRYRGGEWPAGDADLKVTSNPCNGSSSR